MFAFLSVSILGQVTKEGHISHIKRPKKNLWPIGHQANYHLNVSLVIYKISYYPSIDALGEYNYSDRDNEYHVKEADEGSLSLVFLQLLC